MTEPVDVYFSFRSPYSYLATPEMLALEETHDVTVNLRPVLPLAVRQSDFFSPENLKRARYIIIDWVRRAEFLGMVHEWPQPDPIVQDMATMKIADDQPYIFRLSKLGVEAQRQGKGPEFAKRLSHLIFGGTKNWHEGQHMSEVAEECGLDLQQMDAAIVSGDHMDEIEANQNALVDSGHWGVPTCVFRKEPFFGQDRIELLRWRLDQAGLNRAPQ